MDKHSLYYKIMEALQNAKECPLCKLEEAAQHAFLDAFLYEAVTDPKARAELVKTKGYCNRHAHRLIGMQDNLGVAIIYQDQVKLFMDLLATRTRAKSGNEAKRRNNQENSYSNCPACRNQLETRRYYLNTLNEGLREPEMKQAYESSTGFCFPHLEDLLAVVKDPATQEYLYRTEQLNLSRLWDELQEFIRKNDYRHREESFGTERDSWRRAVQKMAGNEEVF